MPAELLATSGSAARSIPSVVLAMPGASYDPIAIAAARTWRQIVIAKAAQSLGISLLLALAGLLALTPGFDGTWRGLLAAFFWGYASDISADALTKLKP
jgi:hypothetical protein